MAVVDPIQRSFGKSVRKHRESKELSQEELAEKAELDRTYISDIERGIRNPGVKNVVRIAEGLGISASQLLEGVHS